MTASLATDGGRSTLRFERTFAHPPERVWQAVTDPAELEQWFPSAVAYEPRVGAPMQFDFGGDHGLDVYPGEVLEYDPPRVFAFAWSEDVLRFELSPAPDGGTLLVFTHAFAHEPGKPARDAAGWEVCLEAFEALLDGREGPARSPEAAAAHHERYLERFGRLEIEGPDGARPVRLEGPLLELDGRPALDVTLDDRRGVLVATGGAFEDGAPVEVRTGSIAEPGAERLAAGTLHERA